ncbi:hypothetical protein BDV25DRAFT_117042 [Aspergillus avenaceus]|uniref:Uncharacterized protein n=1 Tax=Aspergillus avenaceus TaxID=36643 RepID=A0A5N6TVP9_ASPAV|nr:hypothetical protein BDV25DRAFT_117042 [Aspergillus avenaceus]
MSPRKKEVLSAVTATADSSPEYYSSSTLPEKSLRERIHPLAKFFLVVTSSLALSALCFSFTSGATLDQLRKVSRHLEAWWEVGGLTMWRAVEIGLAWILGFDRKDVTSFMFLTHLPTYALLLAFYNIRPTTVMVSYAIILFSTSVPFVLLRKPTSIHDLSHTPSNGVNNRTILQDGPTKLFTTVAAISIFTVALYLSFATWLPTQLALHFANIPDISAANAGPACLPALFLALIPAGASARDFIFDSSTGALSKDIKLSEEPSEGEYLVHAIYRKTWGSLSAKTRVLVARTAILATTLFGNTLVQLAGTIAGVSLQGAVAWASIWASAVLVIGAMFCWVEAVKGV